MEKQTVETYVDTETQTFNVMGMTCAACQAAVERAVSKLPGVSEADVSLLSESMKVEYDPAKVNAAEIIEAVEHAGYDAALKTPVTNIEQATNQSEAANDYEVRSKRMQEEMEHKKKVLISSLILLAILMCFSMLPMMGIFTFLMSMDWMMVDGIIQLFLATIILFIQRDFFTHGFKTLFHGNPNMDILVALGSSVSFVYGFYGLLKMAYGYGIMDHQMIHSAMDALYFEGAAMIVTLVSLGKYLEARSKTKTGDALAKLVKLAPKTALVQQANGEFVETPVDAVQVGTLIKIVPGATIPVDGVVVSGTGTVDQAALTGESIPVDKKAGDEVMSATTNLNGSFIFRATKVGNDTTLSQIISLVDEAGNSKAPIARLADRVSAVFVPTVLVLAALTFIGWLIAGQSFGFALNCAISVLVISCPCALGLATPLAIMVATGKAAQNGILVKSASALEELAKINTVVLDKTGTITKGKPAVASITLFNSALSEKEFLQLAASAESGSEHPLAKAILEEAKALDLQLLPASNFEAFGGRGLKADVDGLTITAGNPAFMKEQGIGISAYVTQRAQKAAKAGGTPLYFAINGKLTGLISVADEVRETSRQAISMLRKEGIEVIMLTGDNAQTAQAIASKLDLSDVIADVLPADKESVIRQLQEEGRKTVMVGDGINDAPALMRSDVGIAIGAGTDIAIDAADIVLMKNNLMDVVTAISLSKATIRNIKENLFWAFFYNILGIPLAAGLYYPFFGWLLNPMFGSAAMSFSSITVCLNALRLRFFKPAKAEVTDSTSQAAEVTFESLKDPDQKEVAPAADQASDQQDQSESQTSRRTDAPHLNPAAAPTHGQAVKPMKDSQGEPIPAGLKKKPLILYSKSNPVPNPADLNAPADNGASGQAAQETPVESASYFAEALEPAKAITMFNVNGMSCMHCVNHVLQALKGLDGVTCVKVVLHPGTAYVESLKPIAKEAFVKAIDDAGYEVEVGGQCQTLDLNADLCKTDIERWRKLVESIKNPSISWIWVDLEKHTLEVCGQSTVELASIEKALFEMNHEEQKGGDQTMTLEIAGMSCAHCQARVEKALAAVAGVDSVKVDLAKGTATVEGKDLDAKALAHAVTDAGYAVTAID